MFYLNIPALINFDESENELNPPLTQQTSDVEELEFHNPMETFQPYIDYYNQLFLSYKNEITILTNKILNLNQPLINLDLDWSLILKKIHSVLSFFSNKWRASNFFNSI